MTEHLHPGPHPDAGSLSAFLEGALPEHERVACLAHFAECARCREVVFFAQHPKPVVVSAPDPISAWRRWLTPIPVLGGVLALCAVAVFVFLLLRKSPAPPPPQSAAHENPVQPAPAKPAPAKPAPTVPEPTHTATSPAVVKSAPGVHHRVARDSTVAVIPSPPAQILVAPPIPSVAIDGAAAGPDSATAGGLSAVNGTVTDPAGAIISGATVTLRQTDTNASSSAKTDASGRFTFTALPAGRYELGIESPGFQRALQRIELQPHEVASLNPVLQVGSVTETVEVSSASPGIVNTEMSELSSTVRPLPSKLPAAITAAIGKRILTVDSSGALFFSKNAGKRWKRVKQFWQGNINELEVVDQKVFQVTTDSGAVWLSPDGAHFHPAPPQR